MNYQRVLGFDVSITHGSVVSIDEFGVAHVVHTYSRGKELTSLNADSDIEHVIRHFYGIAEEVIDTKPLVGLIDFDVSSVHWPGQSQTVVKLAAGLGSIVTYSYFMSSAGSFVDFVRPVALRQWLSLKAKASKAEVWASLLRYTSVDVINFSNNEDDRDSLTLAVMALFCEGYNASTHRLAFSPPSIAQVDIHSGRVQATNSVKRVIKSRTAR